jgi:hypothetical protein
MLRWSKFPPLGSGPAAVHPDVVGGFPNKEAAPASAPIHGMERAGSPFGPIRAMTLGVAQGWSEAAPLALAEAVGHRQQFRDVPAQQLATA